MLLPEKSLKQIMSKMKLCIWFITRQHHFYSVTGLS